MILVLCGSKNPKTKTFKISRRDRSKSGGHHLEFLFYNKKDVLMGQDWSVPHVQILDKKYVAYWNGELLNVGIHLIVCAFFIIILHQSFISPESRTDGGGFSVVFLSVNRLFTNVRSYHTGK